MVHLKFMQPHVHRGFFLYIRLDMRIVRNRIRVKCDIMLMNVRLLDEIQKSKSNFIRF